MKRECGRVGVCVLAVVALAIMGFVGPAAAATTHTWTSTADFDLGVKSQPGPADGNYEVETSTDNPGITAGQVELGSLKGDAFTLADADADTFKWSLGPDVNLPGDQTRTITGGALDLDVGTCVGTCILGEKTAGTITGDWDVSIKMTIDAVGGGVNQWEFEIVNEDTRCSGITMDGVMLIYGDGTSLSTYKCLNGVLVSQGSTPVSANPIWLRVTRATDTFTTYWSSDGSAWTQHAQFTDANVVNPMYSVITLTALSSASPGALFDDYHVRIGTVSSGGWRTTGMWTTDDKAYTTEVVQYINLTYSGATGANYITRTRLLKVSDSSALFTDATDLTSGTTKSYAVPYSAALQTDWKVEVQFTGGGAGTPALESVIVWTNTPLDGAISAVPSSGDAPLDVSFTGSATGGAPPYTNWSWAFGDAGVGYGQAVSHTYGDAGSYTVNLTVTDTNGNTNMTSTLITVSTPTDPGAPVRSAVGLITILIGSLFGIVVIMTVWLFLVSFLRRELPKGPGGPKT